VCAALPVTSATFDGEAVIVDRNGVSDFDALRAALTRRGSRSVFLMAFNVLELDGADLRSCPCSMRRELLTDLVGKSVDGIALSERVDGVHGPAIYLAACRMGLEGIVSKRVDRPIAPATR
jgi:bifunctional non-homologous end joining protein LigD